VTIRYTGARIKRLEDRRLLRGQGRYVDDLVLPRMLRVAFVRSPHAHADIVSLDAAAARDVPGVVAVVTAPDLGARPLAPRLQGSGFTPTAWPPLAEGRVHFSGQTVAAWLPTDGSGFASSTGPARP
jgi:carbon-monoxide dehydrogenase large subunit